MATRSRARAGEVAAFGAIYVIWGSTYLAIDMAVETIPPLLMIGVRCLLAGTVLYVWSRARGAPRAAGREWLEALVAGGLLFLGGQGMLAWAEQRVASGSAALLNGTIPMFVALLGWRGGRAAGGRPSKRPGPTVIAGLVLGLSGVALTVSGGGSGSGVDAVGAMVLLVASLSWAAGSFQANGHHASWPARRAGMHLLAGGALLGLASIATGEAGAVDPSGMTPRSLLALGYLVLFGTLVGYSAFVWLLGRTDPSRVASHAYVNPVVAVTLGVVIAREPITVATVLGAILIVFAVAMIVASQAKGRESTRVAAAAPAAASKPDRRRSGRRGGVRGVEVRTECRT